MWFWLGNPFLVLFLWLNVIFKVKTSISRSNKQKYPFKQIQLGTCVIPLFLRILSNTSIYVNAILFEKSIRGIILSIQADPQGQKVISKVKNVKIWYLRNKIARSVLCLFGVIFYLIIYSWNYFDDKRPTSRSKAQFQGQVKGKMIFSRYMCKNLFNRRILSEKCLFSFTSVIRSHPQGQI